MSRLPVAVGAARGRVREAVLALVQELERSPGRPAADVITDALRRARNLGSIERRFVAETVHGMLRQKRRVEAALALGSRSLRPALVPLARFLVYLVLEEGLRPEEAAHELRREAPDAGQGVVDFVAAAQIDGATPELGVRLSYPDWIVEAARRAVGAAEAEPLLAAMNERAPLCVRANRLRGGRDELAGRLAAEGVATRPTSLAQDGLICEARTSLFASPSFREGWFEVQDEGSQLVGELTAPPPRGTVVDACAGAGGKTLQLASLTQGRGRILALDPSERRLEELRRRARRAGLSNVRAQAIAPAGALPDEVERLRGRVDRVLCDVPCSGLGVLRRNPESRWRVTPADVARLAGEQLAILGRFADLCAIGGRLVYATCSFLPEEDEDVVRRFLDSRTDFVPVAAREILGKERALAMGDGEILRVWPHRQGTDGFFAAVMRRVA